MSEIEEEGTDVGGGGDGRREDEKREEGNGCEGRQEDKRNGCEGHVEKDKRMAFFRFRKVRSRLQRRRKRPSSPAPATGCSLGKWGRGGGGGYHLCFKPPQTLDSSAGSHTSDPNSPEFSYELLRAFIEKNDFYSKECNPHLNADNVPSSVSDK